MTADHALLELLAQLRRAYPGGVPDDEYMALLAVLSDDMSEENVAIVVAELINGETVVVANDTAAAHSHRRPSVAARARVRAKLASVGCQLDVEPPVAKPTAINQNPD